MCTVWRLMPQFAYVVWVFLVFFLATSGGTSGWQPVLPPSPAPAEYPTDQGDYNVVQTLTPLEVEAVFDVWGGVNEEHDWRTYYGDPCWGPTGITCDVINGTYYVTALELGTMSDDSTNIRCGVKAYIHPSLFTLVHLTSLQFDGCFVNASVYFPPDFSKLVNLKTLSFQKNPALIGELPPQISNLTSLQRLILLQNNLQGKLPSDLGSLTNLFQLELFENHFTGEIPQSVGNLRNLVVLDFSRNRLEGAIPPELGKLQSLQMLDLGSNYLQGRIPESLTQLSRLVLLDLGDNNLTGGIPESFSSLFTLQYFVLSRNSMRAPLPGRIWSGLKNLAILDLSKSGFTDSIPPSMGNLTGVRYLALDGNDFAGDIPGSLGLLPQIQNLNLSSSTLVGYVPFTLEFVLQLGKNLDLSNNSGLCYPPALEGTALALGLDRCTGALLASIPPPPPALPLFALPLTATGGQQGKSLPAEKAAQFAFLLLTWMLFGT